MIGPLDRLSIREDLQALQRMSDVFHIVFVDFSTPETNYDPETTSARNVSVGDGTGRVVSGYRIYSLRGRVRYVDEKQKLYGRVPLLAEVGDAVLAVRKEHERICREAQNDPNAYISFGGKTYRIVDLEQDGVGYGEEWQITARAFSPDWRAPGT